MNRTQEGDLRDKVAVRDPAAAPEEGDAEAGGASMRGAARGADRRQARIAQRAVPEPRLQPRRFDGRLPGEAPHRRVRPARRRRSSRGSARRGGPLAHSSRALKTALPQHRATLAAASPASMRSVSSTYAIARRRIRSASSPGGNVSASLSHLAARSRSVEDSDLDSSSSIALPTPFRLQAMRSNAGTRSGVSRFTAHRFRRTVRRKRDGNEKAG